MLNLSSLKPTPGSRRRPIRLGMGEGSGTGQTATRGQKGQRSRSGDGKLEGFEGGQTPLLRRVPKLGFSNRAFRVEYQVVSLAAIESAFKNQKEVTLEALRRHGLTGGKRPVKILADGTLSSPHAISAHAFSKSAVEKIKNAGGTTEVVKA